MPIKSQGTVKYTTFNQVRAAEDNLMSRAAAAYARAGGHWREVDPRVSGVATYGGKHYVVLRNESSGDVYVVRVYRVRNDGQLKGLRRWPAKLDDPRALRR